MSPLNCTISKDTSQMKTFIIEEKYVGYADVTIHAETEEQAPALGSNRCRSGGPDSGHLGPCRGDSRLV